MSKLIVTIEKILDIQPITGADKIVLATVKGWNCIIQKDTFNVGDACVFIPIDSVLPEKLIEEQKLTFLKGHGRVTTIKLKGTLSQGLILPLSILKGYSVQIGDNVADVLKIKKYEPEVKRICSPKETYVSLWKRLITKEITLRRFAAKIIGMTYDMYFKPRKNTNPNFKEYTDIQNQKHYPVLFEKFEEVIITEKIHGTNFRAGCLQKRPSLIEQWFHLNPKFEFVYGSHTVQKLPTSGGGYYGEDVYGKIAELYKLKDLIPPRYTIYGEIYGENKPGAAIQKGFGYGVDKIDVKFFDVKYDGKYLDWQQFEKFCGERNLPIVPVLYRGPYSSEILKECTDGNTVISDVMKNKLDQIREGCVVKPLLEAYSNQAGRKILKSVSAVYLLLQHKTKTDETTEFQH